MPWHLHHLALRENGRYVALCSKILGIRNVDRCTSPEHPWDNIVHLDLDSMFVNCKECIELMHS